MEGKKGKGKGKEKGREKGREGKREEGKGEFQNNVVLLFYPFNKRLVCPILHLLEIFLLQETPAGPAPEVYDLHELL